MLNVSFRSTERQTPLRKSDELRPLAGQKNNVFLPAKVGLAGDPPTEQELLSLFYQQCLKHGTWGNA